MIFIDSWLYLASKKKRNCLSWSTSAVFPHTFNKRLSFWLPIHLQMHFITPARLKLNRKEKHISQTNQQVKHPISSHQLTPTSLSNLLSRLCQILGIIRRTFIKTIGITKNKLLPGNGVIITIQHDMIHQNAKLGIYFWKKNRHPTCLTEPW